jgi:hypothetical protein
MLDHLMELSRKATESSLQTQQTLLRHWTQGWLSTSSGMSTDWGANVRSRWIELTVEVFNKHREALEATCKASLETMEKAFRTYEARSTEASLHAAEEVWKTILETIHGQAESQLRDIRALSERLLEMAQNHGTSVNGNGKARGV